MTLSDAKSFLGPRWLFHPQYDALACPHHAAHAQVNVERTFLRVRHRLRKQPSFSMLVEQTKARLRVQHLRRVA